MQKFFIFFVSTFLFHHLHADPWGKDADLACQKKQETCQTNAYIKTPFLGVFGEVLIGFHQNVISPADGPRSHYIPSSSQYTLEAMRKYGFFTGFHRGCDRLMRENDEIWVYRTIKLPNGYTMKWDPLN